jgi:beta-galactosidase
MIRPVIEPAFYWDFGPVSPVTALPNAMICTNLTRLEIFVGGEHFTTVYPDTERYGNLMFAPSFVDFRRVDGSDRPELRIDGYFREGLYLSRTFSGDPSTDVLSLTADDAELAADGVDMTRLELRAVDAYGAPRPYVRGDVALTVTGPADLVGENPFPLAATGGAGAVWIRTRAGSPGDITVRAEHDGLGTATAVVRSGSRTAPHTAN